MKLHSKNIAKIAGASNNQIEEIAQQMINEENISVSRAKKL